MVIRKVHFQQIQPITFLLRRKVSFPCLCGAAIRRRATRLAQVAAIGRSQAVIEFNMDGTIITANRNFLDAMGYRLEEIQGKHQGCSCRARCAKAPNTGRSGPTSGTASTRPPSTSASARAAAKSGSRRPTTRSSTGGKPIKVVKFASDITSQKIRSMEDAGKIAAIDRAQAVIEFNLDGTIITANENFLGTLGYSLAEIQGKHHSMFVAPAERESGDYREFWAKLSRGEFQFGRVQALRQGGKEVWILASYNPILDDTGKPFKVVKFASDVTQRNCTRPNFAGQIEAIGKSQAVIEFNMDGQVLTANENFLDTLGYSLAEIQGKHHSMFMPAEKRDSPDYREFWANLNRGEYQSGEYKRIGKGGKEDLDPGVLQPDSRSQRQALQGGEIRHRHDRAGDCADEG